MPKLAPQIRTAFSSMALNTRASDRRAKELMTLSTSEVAVSCSSASSRSRQELRVRFLE